MSVYDVTVRAIDLEAALLASLQERASVVEEAVSTTPEAIQAVVHGLGEMCPSCREMLEKEYKALVMDDAIRRAKDPTAEATKEDSA